MRAILRLGRNLALARVATLWLLLYLKWSGQESIASVLLILLLYPEALLLPQDPQWTLALGLLFSFILAVGSMMWAAVLVAAGRLMR